MPEQNFTTKYRVDISDLKKGISDANKSIKLANAEFKNATAGMDDWSKSADGLTAKIKQQNSIVDAEKKKLDLLKEQLDRLNKAQSDGQKIIDDLNDKYNEAVKTYGATSEEAKKYAKQLSEAQAAQERNATAADDLNLKILNQDTAVKNAAAQVDKYEAALQQLTDGENDAADASGKLDKSVGDVDKSAKDTVEGGLNAFGVAIGNLASNLILNLINKLGDLAGAVKNAFLEFDEGADNVIRATGASGDVAKELTKSYANVSKSIVGDFGDIGDALGEVNTRFGFTGKELEDTTTQFLKFADITGTDGKKAVQLVSRAMQNAVISSDKYSDVLDDLATAAQASGISVDKLAENLTKYGAPMRELGFDTKESIAIFSQWEKAGVNTETAFAGMKKAVSEWIADGKNAKTEFQSVLDQIAAAPDITSATAAAIDAFGNKAGPELADAIQTGRFEYKDFLDLLQNSQGSVNETYGETQDAVDKAKLAIQNIKTTAAELAEGFMGKYGPDIERAIATITDKLEEYAPKVEQGIQWLIDHLPEIEAGVVGIAAAFAAWKIAGIITAVTTALAGMSAAEAIAAAKTWLLNTAMLANPIGLVVAAIAALVAAFVVLWKKSENFRNFWKGLWKEIKATTEKYIGAVVDFFKTAWNKIKAVWSTVTGFYKGIWFEIKKTTEKYIGAVVDFFKSAWNNIKKAWNAVVDFFVGIWEGIKAVFSAVGEFFRNVFETAVEAVKTVWNAIISFFTGIWEGIKEVFAAVADFFKQKFTQAIDTVKNIWNAIIDFYAGLWNGIKDVFKSVGTFFKDKFTDAYNKIKDVFKGITDFFGGIWDKIKDTFSTVGTKIGDAFSGAFKAVVNTVFEFIENRINGFISAINGAIDVINKIPGVDIGQISAVELPRLEKGGVLKRGQIGLLEGNGSEAVIPLENDTDGLKKIAGMLAEEMQRGGNVINNSNGSRTVYNYNFNQTNNSPKSLSRYDIYRQTKNLINAAKGV